MENIIYIWKSLFTSDLEESMSFWLPHSLAIPRSRHFPHGRSPSHLCKWLFTYGNYHFFFVGYSAQQALSAWAVAVSHVNYICKSVFAHENYNLHVQIIIFRYRNNFVEIIL